MARKVFISFLGTNDYLPVRYQMPNQQNEKVTRFVQETILDELCGSWTESDRVFVFLTENAKQSNWYDNGHKKPDTTETEFGLKGILEQKPWANIVCPIDIKDGFSEEEIWEIFDVVIKQLEDGDEIYFDVTHAFRSIPMFSMVLFNYSRFMRNTSLKKVYYGAFEKLGPAYKVKAEIPNPYDRVIPILDLTSIALLQQYTEVASAMKNFGRVAPIKDVIAGSTSELNDVLKQLSGSIERFDNSLQVNDYNSIKEGRIITGLSNSLKAARKNKNLPSAFREIIKTLLEDIDEFNTASSEERIVAAINWCIRYKMFQQAYTLGREYVLSRLYNVYETKNPFHTEQPEKDFREYISAICSISDEDIANKEYKGHLGEYQELTEWFLRQDIIKNIRHCYRELGEKRNIINHAKAQDTYTQLFLKPDDNIITKCIHSLPENIFINLTNHPASEWDDKQREEAEKKYGRIIDLQFPDVAPDANEKTINKLADEYLSKVLELSKGCKPTVHIMGEMTLTLSLVERLKAENISCVASTTERKVQELPSGEKVSQFKFVRFRRY